MFAACNRGETTPTTPPENITPLPQDTQAATPTGPTAVVQTGAPMLTVTAPPIQESTPIPDPLQFVFPTLGTQPVSAWRPALYPTPWALTPYDHFYFARPVAPDQVLWPVADYRYGGTFFRPDLVHTGVDIPVGEGTPALAAGPGKVVWAGYGLLTGILRDETDPYGLAVAIRHDFGYQNQPLFTIYAHLQRIDVIRGQWLDTGDEIGLVGRTGFTTGPHLHFEVRLGENNYFSTRNPELWLVPPQGWGVLAAQIKSTNGALLRGHSVWIKDPETEELWKVITYAEGSVNVDSYYDENMVFSDLPAGRYIIEINYVGRLYTMEVDILPGLVSYFTFNGKQGFDVNMPPTPGPEFAPSW